MNRNAALLVLFAGLGCSSGSQPTTPRPKPAGALSRAEIESSLMKKLKWDEIHLTEESKGRYAGTGVAKDKVKYEIKVTQGDNVLKWEYRDEKGNGGNGAEGWEGTTRP